MFGTTNGAIKRASLLGIPTELRLEIYQLVCQADIDHLILKQWKHTHSAQRGFISVPEINRDEKLVIPWIGLSQTCAIIAMELRGFMQGPGFLDNAENTKYVLDLEAKYGGTDLGAASWRRLPCAPSQVQCVEAYYNASRGLQTWGDGGPHGITSGLYQTLNHLIHCGPKFDSRRPLPATMHIKKLHLIVESRGVSDEESPPCMPRDRDPETTLYSLGSIVGQIVNTGVLRGFVDHIQLSLGEKDLNWHPIEKEGEGIPEYWNRYGFDWGMELYQS